MDDLTFSHNRWAILAVAGQMPVGAQMLHQYRERDTNCSHCQGLGSKKQATGRGRGALQRHNFETLQHPLQKNKIPRVPLSS